MRVINENNIDLLKDYPDNYFEAILTALRISKTLTKEQVMIWSKMTYISSLFKGPYLKSGGLQPRKWPPRKWTEREIEWVKMLKEKGFNVKEIAECIDRDSVQVSIKLKRLGKINKTYNEPHKSEKYITNDKFIKDLGIESVLDLYAGSKSYYSGYVKKVVTNDKNKSYDTNYNFDALTCICMLYAENKKYDLIDLDPFGSAYDCFDLAIKMAKKGLIITFGEMGHKRFKRLDFVRRYYGIQNMEDFTTENLINHIIKIGERNKKSLIPIYVKDWKNIARVYFKIEQFKITEQWVKDLQ